MTAGFSQRHRKWLGWLRLLAGFVSVQIVIQLVGFLSGFLLVNYLSKREWACLTIGNSMLAMMNMLADNGISSALSAIGGRVCDEPRRFGSLVNTALRLRRFFASAGILLVSPFLAWALLKQGAHFGEVAGISSGVLLALFFQLTVGIYSIVPRLKLQTRRVQNLDLSAALLRVALLLLAWLLFLNATVAVYIGAVALGLQYALLRRWVKGSIQTNAAPSPEFQEEIVSVVKRQTPNTIYYCLNSQLSIWILSFFGSSGSVADFGALGRLGMVFSILGSVMAGLVLPRFARCQSPSTLKRRYWQILCGYAFFGGILIAISAVFPAELLWILGNKYSGLQPELLLMISGAVLSSIDFAMYSLNTSRGWIVSPLVAIPSAILVQAFLIWKLDVSVVRGVLLLGIFSTIPHMLINYWTTRQGIQAVMKTSGEGADNDA